jgi:sortase A
LSFFLPMTHLSVAFSLVTSLSLTAAVVAAPSTASTEATIVAPAETLLVVPQATTPKTPAPKAVTLKTAAPKAATPKVATSKTRPFRLIVPVMGLDIPVVSGISDAALRVAPGHDPLSARPGEPGNCVIASHRNVYGAYFWYLTKLTPGSLVTVQTPREVFTYKVTSARLVSENQTDVLENHVPAGAPPRLTLYTCTLPVSPNVTWWSQI